MEDKIFSVYYHNLGKKDNYFAGTFIVPPEAQSVFDDRVRYMFNETISFVPAKIDNKPKIFEKKADKSSKIKKIAVIGLGVAIARYLLKKSHCRVTINFGKPGF